MPELPEVEALARFVADKASGATIERAEIASLSAIKTYQPPVDALVGRGVAGTERRGKYLLIDTDGLWLVIHLALGGWLQWREKTPAARARPGKGPLALRLGLSSGSGFDVTEQGTEKRLALWLVTSPDEVDGVARLGPDPLRTGMQQSDPDRAWARIAKSGRTFAELLMDQSVLAGVGNVYRCEVLFRHRVNPFRPGKEIRKASWQAIWDDLVRLMPLGVTFNQILTMQDQVEQATALAAAGRIPQLTSTWTDSARRTAPGPAGVVAAPVVDAEELADIEDAEEDEEDSDEGGVVGAKLAGMPRRYYVYRRQGERCRVCGSRVRTKVVAGRNLFWCGNCQRRR